MLAKIEEMNQKKRQNGKGNKTAERLGDSPRDENNDSQMTGEFQLIPEDQKAIELINDEGEIKEVIMLDDMEPIFQTPFRQLIIEAFQQGKHFFLAKMVTRRQVGQDSNTLSGNSYQINNIDVPVDINIEESKEN